MDQAALSDKYARFDANLERFADIYERAAETAVSAAKPAGATTRRNPGHALFVVIVYNDMHAALRAAETFSRHADKFCGQMRQRLMPVPVTQLQDPARFDHLLSDASSADMIIVSFNGPGDFPTTLKKWIADCLAQKRADNAAIVALLSSNERLDAPDSPRYQFLKNATWAAGLNFFAPRHDAVGETTTSSH
jgi:hypothetical protein